MYFEFTQTTFWITLLFIAVIMGVLQGTCGYLTLLERKIAAWTQDRVGPNRVGPFGLFQPIVDGIKFLFKEEVIPGNVDKVFYLLAPGIALTTATLAFAVVPFGPTTPAPMLKDYRKAMADYKEAKTDAERGAALQSAEKAHPIWPQTKPEEAEVLAAEEAYARATGGTPFKDRLAEYNKTIQFVIAPHVDIGIVWVFAISSLTVYAIVLGGWSSNNKYSFLGSLRSSAQLISYEIPLGASVLGIMLVTGSLSLERMIDYQTQHGWNVFFQPLAALLFATSIFAECNRLPFDLPETEQELVGGYHTEYSALKFGLFMLGEYTHMITTSFLIATVFFGGWALPGVATPAGAGPGAMVAKVVVLGGKMILFVLFYMFVRWTIPRFRFDQLMALAWKVLMPLALVNVVFVLIVKHFALSSWWLLPLSIATFIAAAAISLSMPAGPSRAPLPLGGRAALLKESVATR
jgi:NADH-quinone oxidoreductase subunit H